MKLTSFEKNCHILRRSLTQTLFFTFNYLELNKLKIFKWKLIHFILPCKELLKQWRIVNNSDCLVCKEKENYKYVYFDCKYSKTYWQEVKKMTTNLYIGDPVFNIESLVFGYKIYRHGMCFRASSVFVVSISFWFPQRTHYFWRVFWFLFMEHKQYESWHL